MQWELRGDRPIYQQLVEKLTEQIVSGQLSAGEKGTAGARAGGSQVSTRTPCSARLRKWSAGPDVHQPHERTRNGGQRNDW